MKLMKIRTSTGWRYFLLVKNVIQKNLVDVFFVTLNVVLRFMINTPTTWRNIPFSKWLRTMVGKSPKDRVVGPLTNWAFHGL